MWCSQICPNFPCRLCFQFRGIVLADNVRKCYSVFSYNHFQITLQINYPAITLRFRFYFDLECGRDQRLSLFLLACEDLLVLRSIIDGLDENFLGGSMFEDSLLFKSEPVLGRVFYCNNSYLLNSGKHGFPVCCSPLCVVLIGGQQPFRRFIIEVVDSFWCSEHICNYIIAICQDANSAPSKHSVNSNVIHSYFSLLLIDYLFEAIGSD